MFRRATINNAANRWAMRLAKGGDAKRRTKSIAWHGRGCLAAKG